MEAVWRRHVGGMCGCGGMRTALWSQFFYHLYVGSGYLTLPTEPSRQPRVH